MLSKLGQFIDFNLDFSQLNNEEQALAILNAVEHYNKQGATKVGIIYSANRQQSVKISANYSNGIKITTATKGGANQAEIIENIENLLTQPNYVHLQEIFEILPISTCEFSEGNGEVKDAWLAEELNAIEVFLKEGGTVLGWQNQNKTNELPYAIGSGISKKLTDKQNTRIQETLTSFKTNYPIKTAVFISSENKPIANKSLMTKAESTFFKADLSVVFEKSNQKNDSVLYVADVIKEQGKKELKLENATYMPYLLTLPNGQMISAYQRDLTVWDMESGKCIKTIRVEDEYSISGLMALPNSQIVSIGREYYEVWDVASGKRLNIEGRDKTNNENYFVLPDDQEIRSGLAGLNGKVVINYDTFFNQVWDVESGNLTPLDGSYECWHFSILPNGQVVGLNYPDYIRIWDGESGKCLKSIYSGNISAQTVLPNGQIAGVYEDTIKIWDMSSGQCLKTLEWHPNEEKQSYAYAYALSVLPNGQLVVVYPFEQTLKIWPRKLIYSPETCIAIETKLFSEALNTNDSKKIIDFSDVILPNTHSALIAQELATSKQWQAVRNMCPYNDQGFEPLATFIDDERISFQINQALIDLRCENGGTILHYLVRLHSEGHKKTAIEKLMHKCLLIGVDVLIQDKNGKIAAQLAWDIGADNLRTLLQKNRPAFDLPQIVLDWCVQEGWHDVIEIDGSRAMIELMDEQITESRNSPAQTTHLSIEHLKQTINDRTQTMANTISEERHITFKLDRTLAASNKNLTARISSEERADTKRRQLVKGNSNENTKSLAKTGNDSTHQVTGTVKSSQWNSSRTVSSKGGFSLFGISAEMSESIGAANGGSTQQSNEQSKTHTDSKTTQESNHNTENNQATLGDELSQHNSTSHRGEQERQMQFSIANGKQQQQSSNSAVREEDLITFKEGYDYINSVKRISETVHKKIDMQYSLGGEAGIRCSQGKKIYVPLVTIFKERQNLLEQVYHDYSWNFEQETVVFCTISGNYDDHKMITKRSTKEHPLYHIKRLIEELVMHQNEQRKQSDHHFLAWRVNVSVNSNKARPNIGSIDIRCNPHTDTEFLKNTLKQFVDFSRDESLTESELMGFTILTLTFGLTKTQKVIQSDTLSIPASSPISKRLGLRKVYSEEFKAAFFNQVNLLAQQHEAALLTYQVMKQACLTSSIKPLEAAVEGTVLQLFVPRRLSVEDKLHINALRLALVAFLSHTVDEQLPHGQKHKIRAQMMFCLDFATVNSEAIAHVRNPANHDPFPMKFHKLYSDYLEQLQSVESEELSSKKDSLYQEFKCAQQQPFDKCDF